MLLRTNVISEFRLIRGGAAYTSRSAAVKTAICSHPTTSPSQRHDQHLASTHLTHCEAIDAYNNVERRRFGVELLSRARNGARHVRRAHPEYRYLVEIAQMMFVFADVVDPAPEVTRLVEDIVRSQVIEMIIQSRRLAQRRASKYLSPEDLIFLIRYDRAKVNRLRTYLSWKDVRKNAKDSGDSGGAPSGATEMDALDDQTAIEGPSMKATKMKIRLPWEISSIYSEHVLALPAPMARRRRMTTISRRTKRPCRDSRMPTRQPGA